MCMDVQAPKALALLAGQALSRETGVESDRANKIRILDDANRLKLALLKDGRLENSK